MLQIRYFWVFNPRERAFLRGLFVKARSILNVRPLHVLLLADLVFLELLLFIEEGLDFLDGGQLGVA